MFLASFPLVDVFCILSASVHFWMRTFTFVLFSVFSVYLLLTNNFSNSSKLLNSIVQNSSNFPNSREQSSKKIASLLKKVNTQMSIYHIFQLYLLIIGFILLLYASYLELCNHVIYLPYNTNLTLFRKHIRNYSKWIKIIPLVTIIILIITEFPEFLYNLIPKIIYILFRFMLFLVHRNRKNVQILLFVSLTLYTFKISNEPSSQTFCLLIFQISSSRFLRITPWLPKLLIILANDIHVNPGPHYQNTTNFEPHKNASCIDLIFTDQPNLVLDSGTRDSLDSFCHHKIIYCKINYKIPPPPPFERKIWHYNRANHEGIERSIQNVPWAQNLNINNDPNWQVEKFTEIILNIMSNFIPNEVKTMKPRHPPWITKQLKTLLNRKNRLFKNVKKHGFKEFDLARLNDLRNECKEAIEIA